MIKKYEYEVDVIPMAVSAMVQVVREHLVGLSWGDPTVWRPTLWTVGDEHYADEDAINVGTGVYLTNGYSNRPIVPQGVMLHRVEESTVAWDELLECFGEIEGECQIPRRELEIFTRIAVPVD